MSCYLGWKGHRRGHIQAAVLIGTRSSPQSSMSSCGSVSRSRANQTSRCAGRVALRIYLPVDKVQRRGGRGCVGGPRPKRETLWQRYLHCLQRLPDISAALSHDSTYQPLSAAGQRAWPVCLQVSGCLADSFRPTGHFRHHVPQFPQEEGSKPGFAAGFFRTSGRSNGVSSGFLN